MEPKWHVKAHEGTLEPLKEGRSSQRLGTEVGGCSPAHSSPPMRLSKCFCPSQEVFSCNCLKDPGLCSLPHHSAGPPADESSEFPGYKGVAVYGSGMLNMGGRGACDPNKFQILFPATSSSCVQALRPFPPSPSFPSPEGLLPFTALSPRATPAAGCEQSVCHCVFLTLWVLLEGGVFAPPPTTSPAARVSSPPHHTLGSYCHQE